LNKIGHFLKFFFTGSVDDKTQKIFNIFLTMFLFAAAMYVIGETIGHWLFNIMN
jgi:hypothetical protein